MNDLKPKKHSEVDLQREVTAWLLEDGTE